VTAVRAVVLVDHGSRLKEAGSVVTQLALALRAELPGRGIVVAHLEFEPPSVGDAIDRVVTEGAREVVVLPCFLASGRHTTRDLPRLAEEAEARNPGVSVRCAAPLGAHAGVVSALLDRLSESGGPPRRE
jgi:sirohydrochlorin ferrochelatase